MSADDKLIEFEAFIVVIVFPFLGVLLLLLIA
jgi:hypothetical protein